MKYTTIRIESAILSADILDRIEQGDIAGQLPKDFGFDSRIKVKDEIARAWADAQDLWRIFNRRREKVAGQGYGTTETRNFWMVPLLGLFGYEAQLAKARSVNGKSYAVSHHAANLDGFPLHIVGFNDSLDRKREEGGSRMSPHALLQEYVNLTENLYALVTNGLHLRLLRNSSRLIRLSFIEFDLETMMDEEHFADFAVMYRLMHASRMPAKADLGADSLIEKYHQDALDSGSRIREGLSRAVEGSIRSLANGFLNHPDNGELRSKVDSGDIKASEFYQYQLRLIYRLLFLMVIEERNLVYPADAIKARREIYYEYYSVNRLRRLCEKRYLADERFSDLWIALKNTFLLFESESRGRHLSIRPLAGELFGYQAIGILNQCSLDNKVLLECLRNLNVFTSKTTGQKMRINYASLNVEEFGSVYEGLLEYSPVFAKPNGRHEFDLFKGTERSSTGSHYTQDELVQPLIRHSLDHVIKDRLASSDRKPDKEKALLSIRVCDVACGSGHILLNAARRIGIELARVRTGEDQPSPAPLRQAIRDVIRSCIYGVDKNPLAVELCKVALWLEAHNPGEPLNFLDHHIKCGDSIVGLAHKEELENGIADEAFKKMPDDDKDIRAELAKRNKQERAAADKRKTFYEHAQFARIEKSFTDISKVFSSFNALPENSIQEIEHKRSAYKNLLSGHSWWQLKTLSDIQTAQFFIPKTPESAKKVITDDIFRQHLTGIKPLMGSQAVALAMGTAAKKKFFHWFLEFPEVFAPSSISSPGGEGWGEGDHGFDCILGNPPFLGGQKLSGTFGQRFLEYVKSTYAPAGSCDLVTYFFRRIYNILKPCGFQALISTNTIAQGGAREGGLDVILSQDGSINFAVRSMKWPGLAAVEVALVGIYKGKWKYPSILANKDVERISSYLDDAEIIGKPYRLLQNVNKSFQGSIVLGKGFVLEPHEAMKLIEKNPKNKNVLFPYLNGEDLNTNPDQSPSRWVINFFDWPEEQCRDEYPDCFEILERLVKPERMKVKRAVRREKWWQFAERAVKLYRTIGPLEQVLIINNHTRHHIFSYSQKGFVYSHALSVVALIEYMHFCVLNSSYCNDWAWKYGSTMGSTTLRYTPSAIFETFPFPQLPPSGIISELSQIGQTYHEHRCQLMLKTQLGLTKTYNQFHNPKLPTAHELEGLSQNSSAPDGTSQLFPYPGGRGPRGGGNTPEKVIEEKYGKETLNLWNHLKRTPDTCSFSEAVEGIIELRRLHMEMDETVLKAYGWSERSGDPGSSGTDIDLAHDFYEVDYLPENDRIRYTISPEARKEILKRLLKLNHEIHEQEQKKVSS
jgi:type I restriction-modification system DNA methylase subunit